MAYRRHRRAVLSGGEQRMVRGGWRDFVRPSLGPDSLPSPVPPTQWRYVMPVPCAGVARRCTAPAVGERVAPGPCFQWAFGARPCRPTRGEATRQNCCHRPRLSSSRIVWVAALMGCAHRVLPLWACGCGGWKPGPSLKRDPCSQPRATPPVVDARHRGLEVSAAGRRGVCPLLLAPPLRAQRTGCRWRRFGTPRRRGAPRWETPCPCHPLLHRASS